MSTIGERLRETRENLRMTQAQFAALGGVKKLAQLRYENDQRKPDARYLIALTQNNIDVGYIVTGDPLSAAKSAIVKQGVAVSQIATYFKEISETAETTTQANPAPTYRQVTDDEATLVDDFRASDTRGQQAILATAAAMAASAKEGAGNSAKRRHRT